MILKWKGKCNNFDELPKGDLPSTAVKFREPTSPLMLNICALLFAVPVVLAVFVAVYIKYEGQKGMFDIINSWGIIIAFLTVIPHELLHAIAFPKQSEVCVWYSSRYLLAFVHTTAPTSKRRFIFLSLLPNIIFGLIPFIVWLFLPSEAVSLSNFVYSFSFINLLCGVGDYMNVFNALTQMPKNSITQLSGFNSYWYFSNEE